MKKILSFIMAAMMVVMMLPAVVGAVEIKVPELVFSHTYNLNEKGEAGLTFQCENLPVEEIDILVELYSGEKKLTDKAITITPNAKGRVTCTFYTIGTSSSWKETPWVANDNDAPTHAILYVNGVKEDVCEIPAKYTVYVDGKPVEKDFDWKNLDGTGELVFSHTYNLNEKGEAGLTFQCEGLPVEEIDILVELYSGNEKLTDKAITITPNSRGRVTCTFYTIGTSSSWKETPWVAIDGKAPTHAILYVDGVEVDVCNIPATFTVYVDGKPVEKDFDWKNLDGTYTNVYEACGAETGHSFTEWVREGYKNVRVCTICGKPEVKALTSAQIAADQVKNYVKSRSTVPYAVAIDADETVVITNNTSKNRTIKDLGDSALYGFMTDVKYSFAAVEGYEIVSVTVDGVEVKDPANVKIFQIKKNSVIKVVTAAVEAEEAAE